MNRRVPKYHCWCHKQ